MDRRTSWTVVVVLASAVAACSDADRPLVSEGAAFRSVVSADLGVSDGDADTTTPDDGPCVPRAVRDCKLYYRDDTGQLHCPTSVQTCNVDGTGWLPCGEHTLDEN